MYHRIIVTTVLAMLCACNPLQQIKPVEVETVVQPVIMDKSTQVSVVVSPDRIPQGLTAEDALWIKAVDAGMAKLANDILNDKSLIRLSNQPVFNPDESFMVQKGNLQAIEDPVTKDLSHAFTVRAKFALVAQVAGRVISLDDTRAVAAQHEYITVQLVEPVFAAKGVRFLVCKEVTTAGGIHQQIVGVGKIVSLYQDTAQAILMETVREIEVGDHVYLVQVSVEPIDLVKTVSPAPAVSGTPMAPEFVVRPVEEPVKPAGPAEVK